MKKKRKLASNILGEQLAAVGRTKYDTRASLKKMPLAFVSFYLQACDFSFKFWGYVEVKG